MASIVASREVSMMCVAQTVEIGDAELLHHLDKPPAALVVARGQGIDVALDLQRLAHIGADHAQQILVHPAFAGERHQRDGQPLLEHLAPVRPHAETADIDDMDGAGEEADRLAGRKVGLTTVKSCRWPQVSHGSLVM